MTRKIDLLRKITSVRLLDCSSVETYVDELMSTSHKLASVGFKMNDSWLTAILLMGLPEQYELMFMGLEASGRALTDLPEGRKAFRNKWVSRRNYPTLQGSSRRQRLLATTGLRLRRSLFSRSAVPHGTVQPSQRTCQNVEKNFLYEIKLPKRSCGIQKMSKIIEL